MVKEEEEITSDVEPRRQRDVKACGPPDLGALHSWSQVGGTLGVCGQKKPEPSLITKMSTQSHSLAHTDLYTCIAKKKKTTHTHPSTHTYVHLQCVHNTYKKHRHTKVPLNHYFILEKKT